MLDQNENASLPFRRIFLVAVAIVAAVGFSGQKAEQRRAALDGGVTEVVPVDAEGPPDGWLADGGQEVSFPDGYGRPMPRKPFNGQKTKDCASPFEVLLPNGGCWVKLATPPDKVGGCGKYYEHAGACYQPVPEPKTPRPSEAPSPFTLPQ